jgi:hypothetical protein
VLAQLPRLHTLETLSEVPCLILLGDSGSGKSATLAQYAAELDSTLGPEHTLIDVEAADLRTRGDVSALFGEDSRITAWREGSGVLHLLIDGLDESPIPCESYADLLATYIEQWPRQRVRLRVTVQSTEFRPGIAAVLERAFTRPSTPRTASVGGEASAFAPADGRPTVVALELQPLQQRDAEQFARQHLKTENAVQKFFVAVHATNTAPFAAQPLTLAALLAYYTAHETLHARVPELFEALSPSLCTPRKINAHAVAGRIGRTDGRDWVALASSICAALVFSRSRGLWLEQGSPPPGYLALDAFLGAHARPCGAVSITRADLLAVVSSALFRSDSAAQGRAVTVTQRTYLEFLAALWLARATLSTAQLFQLLGDGDHRTPPVLPHLRSVATWIASMSADVAQALLDVDPAAILWHERADLPDAIRHRAIAVLLAHAESNTLREPDYGFWRALSRLNHPHIGAQLHDAIVDGSASDDARELALQIAQSTEQPHLGMCAVTIALDATNSRAVRVAAARMVAATGSVDNRRRLRPLAVAEDSSGDEQLRGAALAAVWTTLSPSALFAAIRTRRNDTWYGSYAHVLGEIAENLSARYAPAACDWLCRHSAEDFVVDRRLHDAAVLLLLNTTHTSPAFARTLAPFLVARARQHRAVWADARSPMAKAGAVLLTAHASLRRRIVQAVAQCAEQPPNDGSSLPRLDASHVYAALETLGVRWTREDVQWGLQVFQRSPRRRSGTSVMLDFVNFATDWNDADAVGVVWPYRSDPRFADVFAGFPTASESPHAAVQMVQQRRRDEEARWAAEREARAVERVDLQLEETCRPTPSLEVQISRMLQRRSDRQWHTERAPQWTDLLEVRMTDGRSAHECVNVLSALGVTARSRAVDLAVAFLRTRPDFDFTRYGNGALPPAAHAGCWALIVIARYAPTRVADLRSSDCIAWLPAWLRFWSSDDATSATVDDALQHIAASRPAGLATTLIKELVTESQHLENEDAPFGPTHHPDRARRLRDTTHSRGRVPPEERLRALLVGSLSCQRTLAAAVADGTLGPQVADAVLRCLCDLGAVALLRTMLRRVTASRDREAVRALVVASALRVDHAGVRGTALQLLGADMSLAQDALVWLTSGPRRGAGVVLTEWSPADVGQLLRAFLGAFPPEALRANSYSRIDEFRSRLFTALTGSASAEAVDVLAQLVRDMPDRRWLVRHLHRVQAALSDATAMIVEPEELWRLRQSHDQSLIRTDRELAAAICRALESFEQQLHGETPTITSLWDEQRGSGSRDASTEWRPKGEADLSDALRHHVLSYLRNAAPVVVREGVLKGERRGLPRGQRTDLDVTVAPHGARAQRVRVVVEVKCSWNPDVLEAMRDQLVDRYLKQNGLRTGIYVVGFFDSALWTHASRRVQKRLVGSRQQLRTTLTDQAVALQAQGFDVESRVIDCRLDGRS